MAELTPDELRQAFRDALKDSGKSINVSADLEDFLKQVKHNSTSFGQLAKEMAQGKRVYRDFSDQLETLDEKIKDLGDQAGEAADEIRDELIEKRKALATTIKHNAVQQELISGLVGTSKALAGLGVGIAGIAGRTLGNLASGLQSGASAFSLAGGIMEGGIDVANSATHTFGNAIGAVGSVASMARGPIKYLGMAAMVAGPAISGLGDAAAAVGKFIVNFMVKQLEMTVESFNKLSSSGALFSNGMTGMYEASRDAGLTIAQLSNVVAKNAEIFAQSGQSVSGGIAQVGRVGKILQQTGMTDKLLKLGFGFEEQAQLSAEIVAQMRKTVGGTPTDKDVASATMEYAKNLRLIAAITGEDARAKIKAAEGANQILAFQQKVASLGLDQAKINAAVATMTDQEAKNFRDRIIYNGNVINQEGALAESLFAGMRQKGEQQYELALKNGLTAESNADLTVQFGDQIKKSILSQEAFGTAAFNAGGAIEGVAKAGLDTVNLINIYTKTGTENAKKGLEDQANANDALSKGVVAAAKAAQSLAISLQTLVLPRLGEFADFSTVILGEILKALDKFDELTGKKDPDAPGMFETWLEVAGKALGGVLGTLAAGTETVASMGFGSIVAPALMYGGYEMGGMGGKAAGRWLDEKFGNKNAGSDKDLQRRQAMYKQYEPMLSNDYAGLNLKSDEAVAGGKASPALLTALREIQKQYPTARINGINDKWHWDNAVKSDHTLGRGADITVPGMEDPKKREEILAVLNSVIASAGGTANYEKKGEGLSSGDHFHLKSAFKDGGVTSGPRLAGEAGPEAVIPLPDGRTIPVKMDFTKLLEKFDEMIRILKDHKDVSEDILIANQ